MERLTPRVLRGLATLDLLLRNEFAFPDDSDLSHAHAWLQAVIRSRKEMPCTGSR